jgi:phosphoenolpyruvate carboxylase
MRVVLRKFAWADTVNSVAQRLPNQRVQSFHDAAITYVWRI